ncbi:MAG: hypothetical protein AAGI30_02645 [Planctomycetota bacterium]
MCRRGDSTSARRVWTAAGALAIGTAWACAQVPNGADNAEATLAVDAFLESIGPSSVLAAALEERLKSARRGDERGAIARRLAEVYDELIANAEGEARREWERRTIELFDELEGGSAVEVRLDLASTLYRSLRATAEEARFGLVDAGERTATAERLMALANRFAGIGASAAHQVRVLERRTQRDALADESLARARSSRSRAVFLAGYASLYAAELTNEPPRAGRALDWFGRIVNAPDGPAEIDKLRAGLLNVDYIAEAALGVSRSLTVMGRHAESLAWIDSIKDTKTARDHLGAELDLAELAALARAGRWSDAARLLESRERSGDRPSVTRRARFAALLALRGSAASMSPGRAELRDVAIAALARLGEVGHIIEVTRDAPTGSLGAGTFLSAFVGGLAEYTAALDALGSPDGAPEPIAPGEASGAAARFREAAELLDRALALSEADRYEPALPRTTLILGECLIRSADAGGWDDPAGEVLARAAELYNSAADESGDDLVARAATWQAIQALAMAIERLTGERRDAVLARRTELADKLLARFPDSAAARRLRIERAASGGGSPDQALRTLLAVAEGTPEHELARRAAARIAHQLFRAAPPSQRDWHAERFLSIAEPLLVSDRQRIAALASQPDDQTEAASEFASLARLVLEAALDITRPRIVLAERTLAMLEDLALTGLIDRAAIADELGYQRARLLLARGDREAARAAVESLQSSSGPFAQAAGRLFFADADRRLVLALESAGGFVEVPGAVAEAARDAVQAAGPLVQEDMFAEPSGEPDASEGAFATAVLRAAALVWRAGGDHGSVQLGRTMLDRATAAAPRDPSVIRSAAFIAEAAGDGESALEHWRTLSAGLPADTMRWFEARYHLLRLLAAEDVERAQAVLLAHAAVYAPTFGPDPFGPAIGTLHAELVPAREGGE